MPQFCAIVQRSLVLLFLALGLNPVWGQQVRVAGQVVDRNTKLPIPYASIGLLNSYYGAVADLEGKFIVLVPAQDSLRIQVSALGYAAQTLVVAQVPDTIFLQPAAIGLQEVQVKGTGLAAREIVRRAFAAIPKNYHAQPLVLQTFYRHYCQDDGQRGRIIEATVDIYKKRGYGKRETYERNQDLLRINELRRSLDETRYTYFEHAPMAIDQLQKSDVAALEQKPGNRNKNLSMVLSKEHFVDPENQDISFAMVSITDLNGEEVYEVDFNFKPQKEPRYFREFAYTGKLFITTARYAILRFESHTTAQSDWDFRHITSYRKYGHRYALAHVVHDFWTKNVQRNHEHKVHQELVVNNLVPGKQKGITRAKIDRDYLASIPYRPDFWQNYPLPEAHPVPEEVIQTVQAETNLDEQYPAVVAYENRFTNEPKKEEQVLLNTIAENKGLLVVALWASGCILCREEYIASAQNRQALAEQGGRFLMVSLDDEVRPWRLIVELYMAREQHLRIGSTAKFLRPLRLQGVPRYLVYQGPTLIHQDAPQPASPEFKEMIQALLTKEKK